MSWIDKIVGYFKPTHNPPPPTNKDDVRSIIYNELKRANDEIKANMQRYGRNASGRSVRGLKVRMQGYNYGYIEAPHQFAYMERGRGPGGNSLGFLGYIILKWAYAKGITLHLKRGDVNIHSAKPYEAKRVAFGIARSIMENGTRLHRSGNRDDIFTTASRNAERRIKSQLGKHIANRIDEVFVINENPNIQ